MKDLSGSATTSVTATPEECLAVLAAIDRYPSWYPEVVREVEVLERGEDGVPKRARTSIHLAVGPLAHDFHFEVTVKVGAGSVIISRIPDASDDEHRLEIHWRVGTGELGVEIKARIDVPRFVPVGRAGDSVAQGFVAAAKREIDGSSPNASASSS
jgi:Polyketide cyclase / dehydrase and lipid transport